MKHSLWVEIALSDKYIKSFLRNGPLSKLSLTPTEYFIILILIALEKKVSFYELKKLVPIEPKQLHLSIKKLVDKEIIHRNYSKNTSKIWVCSSSKQMILEVMEENYKLLFKNFGDTRLQLLLHLLKEFNDLCRQTLCREKLTYKNPLKAPSFYENITNKKELRCIT